MKYIGLLLALLGLTAASILNEGRRGCEGRRCDDDKTDFLDLFNKKNQKSLAEDDLETEDTMLYNRNKNTMKTSRQADRVFLERQKTVLELLANVHQDANTHMHLVRLGNDFVPHQNLHKFHDQEAIKKFLKNYNNNNFLDQNEVFTPTNQHHQNQAAQLFTFIHSAQDWETMKQAASWAKNRFNKDQFVFSFTAAVLNHPTTQGIVIPALYEIIPHAFVPATTLHKIYKAKLEGLKEVTVKAAYTNQNRNNKNFNKIDNINMDVDDLEKMNTLNGKTNKNMNDENMWGPHNANSVFADNDGSMNNKAGVTENPENKMSYFTEDLGINDLHARFHIQHPVFHGVNKNNNYYTSNIEDITKDNNKMEDIRRGEKFYFAHQQLLARYVLERLSNNLPIPHPVNFDGKIKTGYNPNLQHANGQAVPARPPHTKFQQQLVEDVNNNNNALLPNNNQAQNPKVYEQRLQQVADSGIVMNKDGTKTKLNKNNAIGILANLVAAPSSSLNPGYYGDYYSVAKNAIGNIVDPNNQNGVAPGAVSNYATAARDPAYYQLLTKMNQIFNNIQNKQGPYTKEQLTFSGVKIEKVDVSDMVTFFETVKVNVNNALQKLNKNWKNIEGIDSSEETMKNNNDKIVGDYNVKFQRLANKPYNYKLTVLSNKNADAIVRIFLGPKYDSNGQRFTLPQASKYFVQLDQFKVKLHNGQNIIKRNSQESQINVHDPMSFKELWKRVELARQGQQPFYVNMVDRTNYWGLPIRAQLPKGKREGQQFVLYTIINSVSNTNEMSMEDSMEKMMDDNNMRRRTSSEENDNMLNGKMNRRQSMESSEELDSSINNTNKKIMNLIHDNRSIGFPLDRPIVDVNYNTANQYFKTVTIHHKVNNDK